MTFKKSVICLGRVAFMALFAVFMGDGGVLICYIKAF
jgi:hypothetical protein